MIKLPEIFQDGMVFQQGKPIKVWGQTKPNQHLEIQLDDLPRKTVGLFNDGKFSIELPAQQESINSKLTFYINGQVERTLDVQIGEVWLLAGQSNMDFTLNYDCNYQNDREKVLSMIKQISNIKFYKVPQKVLPIDEVENKGWEKLSCKNAKDFSAIGYYFAIKLAQLKKNKPIAFIWMTYGGTTASSWTSDKALEEDPVLKKTYLDSYKHLLAVRPRGKYEGFQQMIKAQAENPENAPFWDKVLAGKIDHEELSRAYFEHHELFVDYVLGPNSENRPHGLFDTMVKTVVGYHFKGCLWYQGESDDQHAGIYDHLLTALIKDWWNRWNDHFPFLIMQVAPFDDWFGNFNGNFYPEVRAKQECVANTLPGVYLTNVMDDGMKYDIHPKNKLLAAERFYELALTKVYGMKEDGESPRIKNAILNSDKIQVKFENCKELKLRENINEITKVKVNGTELTISNFSANHNILTIKLPRVVNKNEYVELSYQQEPFSRSCLFNENNVPVRPFIKYLA